MSVFPQVITNTTFGIYFICRIFQTMPVRSDPEEQLLGVAEAEFLQARDTIPTIQPTVLKQVTTVALCLEQCLWNYNCTVL